MDGDRWAGLFIVISVIRDFEATQEIYNELQGIVVVAEASHHYRG